MECTARVEIGWVGCAKGREWRLEVVASSESSVPRENMLEGGHVDADESRFAPHTQLATRHDFQSRLASHRAGHPSDRHSLRQGTPRPTVSRYNAYSPVCAPRPSLAIRASNPIAIQHESMKLPP